MFRACAPGGDGTVCEAELFGARECLDQQLHQFNPDAVVGSFGVTSLLCHATALGYPSFQYFRGGTDLKGFVWPEEIYLIANSPYVASYLAQISPRKVGVVLPAVDKESYRVTNRQRRYITFINPIPEKGLDVVLEVARRLPQERFLFVKGGWFDYDNHFINKVRMRSIYSLPNVEVSDFHDDMRRVYGVTDILLVPSRRESFGRVILEAHINGIPVVASNVGGIPFALGRGGLLIDPQQNAQTEAQAYADALRELRSDARRYDELSTLAFENSLRPELDCEHQVDTFIRFVEERVTSRRTSGLVDDGGHSGE